MCVPVLVNSVTCNVFRTSLKESRKNICTINYSFGLIFLQLSVRRKNTKEMFGGFFKNVVKSADEVLFSGVKVSGFSC